MISTEFLNGVKRLLIKIVTCFNEENRYRYNPHQKQSFSLKEAEKHGVPVKSRKDVTLESEYEKIKQVWSNQVQQIFLSFKTT